MSRVSLAACLRLSFAGIFVLATVAWPQDLAALARKEKQRRAKVAQPVKVLTEEDGKAAATAGTVTVISGVVAPATAEAPISRTSDEQKAVWKGRVETLRRGLSAAQDALTATEKEIEVTRSDLAPLDAADAQDPMRLQKREQKIADLITQADTQRKAVAAARKALSDLEDEARKAGIPAGWLR